MRHRLRFVLENLHLGRDRHPSYLLPSVLRGFAGDSSTRNIAADYLTNECGIRPESALTASRYVSFKTPERADSVLRFFREIGFSDSQIPKLIGRRPRLLVSDPEKQFVPRIKFLESKGFTAPDIVKILRKRPEIMHASIENQLLSNYNYIRDVIKCEDKVIRAITRTPGLLTWKLETCLVPNIKILRESGSCESNIVRLLLYQPIVLITTEDEFSQAVERVKQMGVAPRSTTFGVAIQAVRGISSETWESKIDAYKKWGWSEEVTLRAFTKSPWCMTLSEKKIAENMDYYVNQMGFEPLEIANRPTFLSFSLKKRIVPRDTVLQVLESKGLIESRRMLNALHMDDEKFRSRFVTPYEVEAPELSDLFLKMLALSEENDPEMGETQA
ncbi:Transcription termination factor MTERF8, chloroplastic [Linum perenne]